MFRNALMSYKSTLQWYEIYDKLEHLYAYYSWYHYSNAPES